MLAVRWHQDNLGGVRGRKAGSGGDDSGTAHGGQPGAQHVTVAAADLLAQQARPEVEDPANRRSRCEAQRLKRPYWRGQQMRVRTVAGVNPVADRPASCARVRGEGGAAGPDSAVGQREQCLGHTLPLCQASAVDHQAPTRFRAHCRHLAATSPLELFPEHADRRGIGVNNCGWIRPAALRADPIARDDHGRRPDAAGPQHVQYPGQRRRPAAAAARQPVPTRLVDHRALVAPAAGKQQRAGPLDR